MFESLRHLLPDSRAWRVVPDKLLRRYLEGLATVADDAVAFVDDVQDDLYPETTRELEEWETQFGLSGLGSDAARRAELAAAWATTGGQSPRYLQDIMQTAGFPVYVHDWFDATDVSWSKPYGDPQNTIGNEDIDPGGVCFGAGGRFMYMAGRDSGVIYQYDLSGPWDVSTSVYSGINLSVVGGTEPPQSVHISTDGLQLFVLSGGNNAIVQYTLSEAFNVSTAVSSGAFFVSAQETAPTDFAWRPDGSSVYVIGTSSDQVHQYDLSTNWDITTASYVASGPSQSNPQGIAISDDGNHLVMDAVLFGPIAQQWDMSTPWDITTTGAIVHTLDLVTIDAAPRNLHYEAGFLFLVGLTELQITRFLFGGPRNPLDYTDQPLIGTTQAGDTGAECGEQPPSQTSIDSAVCNRFLANDIRYLWNDTLSADAPPSIPVDTTAWPNFLYFGGQVFGTTADIPAADRDRFEALLLKLCPTHQWIVTIVNYV